MLKIDMNSKTSIYLRRFTYLMLWVFDSCIVKKQNRLFILCYHGIGHNKNRFNVEKEVFIKQMLFLHHNCQFISINRFRKIVYKKNILPKDTKPMVLLCFDDGYKSLLDVADFLNNYKIKPVLFPIFEKYVNRKNLRDNCRLLTTKNIKELIRSGWNIGSHGLTHKKLNDLANNESKYEICRSKTYIEKKFGITIYDYAFPHGSFSKQHLIMLKNAGYKTGFSMDDGFINPYTNPFCIPRIGIDSSHSFVEFMASMSPSVINFRSLFKKLFYISI